MVSGRPQIPRISEELTVAAVGGNLQDEIAQRFDLDEEEEDEENNYRQLKQTKKKHTNYFSKSSKITVSGTISLKLETASSSVVRSAAKRQIKSKIKARSSKSKLKKDPRETVYYWYRQKKSFQLGFSETIYET